MNKYESARALLVNHAEDKKRYISNLRIPTSLQLAFVRGNTEEEKLANFQSTAIKLIDGKIVHTERGVKDIEGLLTNFNLEDEYIDMGKAVEVLHDIGRIDQAYYTGNHIDADSYGTSEASLGRTYAFYDTVRREGITEHGRHGAHILQSGLFSRLDIPYPLWEIIYNVVKYHGNMTGLPFSEERLDNDLFDEKSLEEAILDSRYRNKILTFFLQIVRTVDNFDLHNKVIIGETPLVRKFGLDVYEGQKIKDFADFYGIDERILRDDNGYSKEHEIKKGDIIRINPDLVPDEKFRIADDFVQMYKDDTMKDIPLDVLQGRMDYSFLYGQIFRLSTLRNIEFKAMLKSILKSGILEQILLLYPERYQEIMKPFIDFAIEETYERTIDGSSDVYTSSRTGRR